MLVRPGLRRQGTQWRPDKLFASGAAGAWFDPSDLSTVYQDHTGTIPGAVGSVVGLLLDKSQGLGLGSEKVTNGTFDTDASGWTAGSSAVLSVSNGVLRVTNGATAYGIATQSFATEIGKTYKITVTRVAKSVDSNNSDLHIGTNATYNLYVSNALAGTYHVTATDTNIKIGLLAGGQTLGAWKEFDNVSCKEVKGNHASQSTTASKPILGRVPRSGKRNLLTYTEDFSNAAWMTGSCVIATNQDTAPDGTLTADKITANTADAQVNQNLAVVAGQTHTYSVYLRSATGSNVSLDIKLGKGSTLAAYVTTSITVTPSWQRFTLTGTVPVGETSIQVRIGGASSFATGEAVYAWGAQVELSSSATPYQKVVSAYDITEAGVPDAYYLEFDGTDDYLVAGTIPKLNQQTLIAATSVYTVDKAHDLIGALVSADFTGSSLRVAITSGAGKIILGDGISATGGPNGSNLTPGIDTVVLGGYDGVTAYSAVNGQAPVTQTRTLALSSVSGMALGRQSPISAANYLQGRLYGTVVTDYWLSDTNRKRLERYLARKAGVAL